VGLSSNSYKMLFISFYKVVVTLQVDILNIQQVGCRVPTQLVTILINTTNTLKNHNLILFCHGIFSLIEREMISRIDQIKRKKRSKVFIKKKARTRLGDLQIN
jgi:hypothetical protein